MLVTLHSAEEPVCSTFPSSCGTKPSALCDSSLRGRNRLTFGALLMRKEGGLVGGGQDQA